MSGGAGGGMLPVPVSAREIGEVDPLLVITRDPESVPASVGA